MSVKGSWSRVKDIKAWDDNYDNIFKKKKEPEELIEEHKDAFDRLAEAEQKEKEQEKTLKDLHRQDADVSER